jgi:transaldolase
VVEAAKLGAHVATVPAKILRALVEHPLTDKGLNIFMEDWQKTGQKIK